MMATTDVTAATGLPEQCPQCWYESDGEHCERSCEHPACSPCRYLDWATANPVEALEEEERRACDRAQSAEEGDWPDGRQDVAYANHLADVLEEIEERRSTGASKEELEEIARHA